MQSRGFTTAELVKSHFQPSLKDMTHPLKLDQMEKACERLVDAFLSGEKICIYADFDLDGTSGLALMLKGLEDLGFDNLVYYQPKRLTEGYGLHSHVVEEMAKQNVSVMVTVDVGITAIAAAQTAKSLNMDLIITDHHLPKETLPDALAIVNPNKGFCASGLGHLCGAGVAYYLLLALKVMLNKRNILTPNFNAKELLDCFVVGTLTDLVPLIGENRALSKHGLKVLQQTKRPGLRALLSSLGLLERPLSGSDVAIRFAPKLNALSRLEMDVMPIDLFLARDEVKAERLIKTVLSYNEKRVRLQKSAEAIAEDWLRQNSQSGFAFVSSPHFHQGVVGLVATKVSQNSNVPAFIGAENEKGMVTGSARLPGEGFPSLLDALESASEYMVKFGGHAAAAGFEFEKSQFINIERAFLEFYKKVLPDGPKPVTYDYDGEGRLEDINEGFMNWWDQMGPFGSGFETPIFRFSQLEVKSFSLLSGGHIKLSVMDRETQKRMDALWFSPAKNHSVNVNNLRVGQVVDLLGEPQWNIFAGRRSLQLLVKDIRLSC